MHKGGPKVVCFFLKNYRLDESCSRKPVTDYIGVPDTQERDRGGSLSPGPLCGASFTLQSMPCAAQDFDSEALVNAYQLIK